MGVGKQEDGLRICGPGGTFLGMTKGPPPDGYRWTGNGWEMALIDPTECPAGHPFRFGQRTFAHCEEHRGHPAWRCDCGVEMIRDHGDGTFVTTWSCE